MQSFGLGLPKSLSKKYLKLKESYKEAKPADKVKKMGEILAKLAKLEIEAGILGIDCTLQISAECDQLFDMLKELKKLKLNSNNLKLNDEEFFILENLVGRQDKRSISAARIRYAAHVIYNLRKGKEKGIFTKKDTKVINIFVELTKIKKAIEKSEASIELKSLFAYLTHLVCETKTFHLMPPDILTQKTSKRRSLDLDEQSLSKFKSDLHTKEMQRTKSVFNMNSSIDKYSKIDEQPKKQSGAIKKSQGLTSTEQNELIAINIIRYEMILNIALQLLMLPELLKHKKQNEIIKSLLRKIISEYGKWLVEALKISSELVKLKNEEQSCREEMLAKMLDVEIEKIGFKRFINSLSVAWLSGIFKRAESDKIEYEVVRLPDGTFKITEFEIIQTIENKYHKRKTAAILLREYQIRGVKHKEQHERAQKKRAACLNTTTGEDLYIPHLYYFRTEENNVFEILQCIEGVPLSKTINDFHTATLTPDNNNNNNNNNNLKSLEIYQAKIISIMLSMVNMLNALKHTGIRYTQINFDNLLDVNGCAVLSDMQNMTASKEIDEKEFQDANRVNIQTLCALLYKLITNNNDTVSFGQLREIVKMLDEKYSVNNLTERSITDTKFSVVPPSEHARKVCSGKLGNTILGFFDQLINASNPRQDVDPRFESTASFHLNHAMKAHKVHSILRESQIQSEQNTPRRNINNNKKNTNNNNANNNNANSSRVGSATPDTDALGLKIIKELGRGSYGIVYLCKVTDRDILRKLGAEHLITNGDEIGLKVLNTDCETEEKGEFKNEGLIGNYLLATTDQETKQYINLSIGLPSSEAILTKIESEGDLNKYLSKLFSEMLASEDKIESCLLSTFKLINDIWIAMAILHSKGIIHGDLTLANILVDKLADGTYVAKISDYGKAIQVTFEKDGKITVDVQGRDEGVEVHSKFQYDRADQRRFRKKLSSATDLYGFKILVMEAIASLANEAESFKWILNRLKSRELGEIYTLHNDEKLKFVAKELKAKLTISTYRILPNALIKILDNLDGFLSWNNDVATISETHMAHEGKKLADALAYLTTNIKTIISDSSTVYQQETGRVSDNNNAPTAMNLYSHHPVTISGSETTLSASDSYDTVSDHNNTPTPMSPYSGSTLSASGSALSASDSDATVSESDGEKSPEMQHPNYQKSPDRIRTDLYKHTPTLFRRPSNDNVISNVINSDENKDNTAALGQ